MSTPSYPLPPNAEPSPAITTTTTAASAAASPPAVEDDTGAFRVPAGLPMPAPTPSPSLSSTSFASTDGRPPPPPPHNSPAYLDSTRTASPSGDPLPPPPAPTPSSELECPPDKKAKAVAMAAESDPESAMAALKTTMFDMVAFLESSQKEDKKHLDNFVSAHSNLVAYRDDLSELKTGFLSKMGNMSGLLVGEKKENKKKSV